MTKLPVSPALRPKDQPSELLYEQLMLMVDEAKTETPEQSKAFRRSLLRLSHHTSSMDLWVDAADAAALRFDLYTMCIGQPSQAETRLSAVEGIEALKGLLKDPSKG
ncbi:MAG: hypothetical protein AAF141_02705 [Pseudomonadota bacterium]